MGSQLFMDPAPVLAHPGIDEILADDLELAELIVAPREAHVARERTRIARLVRDGTRAILGDRSLAVLRSLPWDSEHFGVPCADLVRLYGLDPPIAHAIGHAALSGIGLLSARCRADRPGHMQGLEDAGFRWVDTSVELGALLGGDAPAADPRVRPACPDDAAAAAAVARTFTANRFHFDPRIARERAEGVYASWAAEAAEGRGERLLVAEHAGGLAGFCGFRPAADDDPFRVATLTLIVIAPGARGLGLFDALYDGVLREVAGARALVTSTQVHNLRSQRAFSRRGMRAIGARHVLHRWSGAAPAS